MDKLFYSMCIELTEDCPAPSYQRFLDDSQIEGLQLLLYSKSENDTSARNFVESLCNKLKLCVTGIRRYLTFVETKVTLFTHFDKIVLKIYVVLMHYCLVLYLAGYSIYSYEL